MSVKQISVFIENKKGALAEVTGFIASHGINLYALSIADTQDFGILRLITDNPDNAREMLKNEGYTVTATSVLAVEIDDTPGSMAAILDVLNNLKKLGYKTAIVSNKHQEGVSSLGKRFFNNNIDVLIGSLETIKLKPHPDMLLLACDKLSLKVDECIFVGDSDVDMITANNANMKVVGVTWGFRDEKVLKENNATYIINTPNELLDLIKEK